MLQLHFKYSEDNFRWGFNSYLDNIFVMEQNLDDELNEVALIVVVHDDDGWQGDLGCSDHTALTSVALGNDDGQEAVEGEGP